MIWDLIKSAHAKPPTREWVTLESRVMKPLVIRTDKGAIVHTVLATPRNESSLNVWGYLCWKWPSCRLLAMVDIQCFIEGKAVALQESDVCKKLDADAIQLALDNHSSIPAPQGKLYEVYCSLLKQFSFTFSAAKQQEKVKMMKDNENKAHFVWKDIRLEVQKRAGNCSKWVAEKVYNQKDIVLEQLRYELRHTPNSKEWVEKDLPFRVRMLLIQITKGFEMQLQQKVASDAVWLSQISKERKIRQDSNGFQEPIFDIEGLLLPKVDAEVADLSNIKLFSRLGVGAAAVATSVIFAPLGIVASIGGLIVTEKILGNKQEKQKDSLDAALNGWLEDVLQAAVEKVQDRLQLFYNKMINECETYENEIPRGLKAAWKINDETITALPDEAINKQLLKIQQIKEVLKEDRKYYRNR
ncbi:MAG: hypothetical protein H6Q73_1143 [Firmicutes bacterium]|nr:hypothetical protein [Bacillota bacterium]